MSDSPRTPPDEPTPPYAAHRDDPLRGNTPAQEPLRLDDAHYAPARTHGAHLHDGNDCPEYVVGECVVRAALSGVPVERPATTWYECSKCGYAYPERGGWAHKESTGHWPPADSPVRVPVEPRPPEPLRETLSEVASGRATIDLPDGRRIGLLPRQSVLTGAEPSPSAIVLKASPSEPDPTIHYSFEGWMAVVERGVDAAIAAQHDPSLGVPVEPPATPGLPTEECVCEGEFIWACGPECECFHHEEMRPSYDFSKGVRGKYYGRVALSGPPATEGEP